MIGVVEVNKLFSIRRIKKGDTITQITADKFCWNLKAPCEGYEFKFKPDGTCYFIPKNKLSEATRNYGKEIEF